MNIRFWERKPRLKLGHSLGAFTKPDGDISPLFVFFEAANAEDRAISISRIYLSPKSGRALPVEPDGDSSVPLSLEPGESARFRVRAKTLARALKEHGHGDRPRVVLTVEDGSGNKYRKTFKFRADEYLALQDE